MNVAVARRADGEDDLAEQQWRLTLDAAPHGIAIVGLDGTLRHVNAALCGLLGYPAEQLRTRTFQDLTHPADLPADLNNIRLLISGQLDKYSMTKRYRHAEGHWILTSLSVAVVRDPLTERPLHFVSTIEDITARAAAEAATMEALARKNAIIAAQSAVASVQLTADAVQQEICARAMAITGADGALIEMCDGDEMVYQETSGIARALRGLRMVADGTLSSHCLRTGETQLCADTEADARANRGAARRTGIRSILVTPLRHGEEIVGVLKVLGVRPGSFSAEDAHALEVLATPFGATMQNAQRMAASFEQAITDPLTGLGNRNHAIHELQRALGRQARNGGRTAVLFLDLDGFKPVNDLRGHNAGDRVLAEVGHRLAATARVTDTVARYGGDEFVIIAEAASGELDVHRLATRLIEALSAPYEIGEPAPACIGVSIGVAVATAAIAPADLLHHADQAMYEAKRGGGGHRVVTLP